MCGGCHFLGWCRGVFFILPSHFCLNVEALQGLGEKQATSRKKPEPLICTWMTAARHLLWAAPEWAVNLRCVKSVTLWGLFVIATNIAWVHVPWRGEMWILPLRAHPAYLVTPVVYLSASNLTCPKLNLWFPQHQPGSVLFSSLNGQPPTHSWHLFFSPSVSNSLLTHVCVTP